MRTSAVIALLTLLSASAWLAGCPNEDGGTTTDVDVSYDTTRPDVPEVLGATGDPCAVGAQCASGLCTPTATGSVCTETCTDSCPDGFACAPADATGETNICWRLDAVACQPCEEDAECQVGGQTGNTCVSYGAAGSFCGLACSGDDACPDDYSCSEGQCVKDDGVCACNAVGVLAGATTSCAVENDEGSCGGTRRCTPGGLTRCDAPTPAAEVCDGRDQNCDGQTDEDTDGDDCSLTNEFGTCTGAVECSDGKPLCVGRAPAAEICNGVDDDCDGETDEDQPDLDLDTIADCVDDDIDGDGSLNGDDCAPRNPAIYPGQTEVCNGIDDNCNHQVDEGTYGVIDDQCGAYICAGVPGCRTTCNKDAHCISGYLCDLDDEDDDGNANECLPSVCGNGTEEIREVCDDGINDGSYGGCLQGCGGLGPRCGDGLRQVAHEACDDGELNGTPNHCNSTCTGPTPPDCGNGVQEAGEDCDLGDGVNSDAPNAECRTDCSVRRCGDGVVDGSYEEACDAGATENGQTVCGCQDNCQWASSEVTCRESEGVCDLAESCNGSGGCPADAFAVDVVCHESTGLCDPAEVCSGSSADCPSDELEDSGTVCRPSTGGCDPEEVCNGETAECPDDAISPPQTVCREAEGLCDIPEVCDGESTACPDDMLYNSTVICRGPSGLCDAAERCTGESAACPDDEILPADTVCRGAAGLCDVVEVCDGVDKACPDDVLDDNTTVCRPADGGCDVAELCDGQSAACPDDAVMDAGEVCRPGTGTCDPAESCNGETAECPDDTPVDDETPCSAGEGSCGFEPCWCQTGVCTQLCGDGVVQGGISELPDGPAEAPLLALEACDAGDLNGARDGCSLMCDGVCDADYSWVEEAGGIGPEGAHAVTVDEEGGNVAVGEFQAYPGGINAPGLPGAPDLDLVPIGAAVFGNEWFFSRNNSRDFFVMAQDVDGNPRWAACGGGSYEDVANGVDEDDHGGVYVTGRFGGVADIDCCEDNGQFGVPGLGIIPIDECEHSIDAFGGYSDYEDVFLAKWDKDGEVQWAVSAGSWGDDSGEDVATDSVGRSVVVGYHSGDQGQGARFGDLTLNGTGYRDIFVAKYDGNGVPMWVKGGGSNSDDRAQGVALDGAGNIFVTGYFQSTFGWDDNATQVVADGFEGSSLFLLGLDSDGDNPWVLTAHSTGFGDVEGTDVAVDGQGGVYVTGYFEDGGVAFGDIVVSTDGGGSDLFVAKASGGEWLWVAVASDEDLGMVSYADEVGFGVDVDRSGKVYVTGEFNDHIQFGDIGLDSRCGYDCIPSAPGLPSQAGYFYGGDGFIAKLSPDGEWLWAKQFGGDGAGPTSSRSVEVDPEGRIFTAGGFSGPAYFDEIEAFGFNLSLPSGPTFEDYSFDAYVGKMVPDGGARCYECGDGALDPGEGCDDGDGLDHCAGSCDGICFGPANDCGDGWDNCDEQYDLGGGSADVGMCLLPSGNLWCFQTAENQFTYDPVEPGVAAALGPGLLEEAPLVGFGGNPTQHPDCPACNPADASVDCRASAGRQWGGDGPPLDDNTTARSVCDGDPLTPPCGTNTIGCSGTATNDEAAAVECADFYEFVANTGAEVAFEFDERTTTQGPTGWSLWVSLSGAEGTWERVGAGATTALASSDFGDGVPSPMHQLVLTDIEVGAGPIANQLDVHFRLYAWGSVSTEAAWVVDNVRVGAPSCTADADDPVGYWPVDADDNATLLNVGSADVNGTLVGGVAPVFDTPDYCDADGYSLYFDGTGHVELGAPPALTTNTSLAISLWFKTDDGDRNYPTLFSYWWSSGDANQASYSLAFSTNGLSFLLQDDALGRLTTVAGLGFGDGAWHHAVASYDDATKTAALYVDGVQLASATNLSFLGPDLDVPRTVRIGSDTRWDPNLGDRNFTGNIDDIQFFDRALDACDVAQLYDVLRELGCPDPPEPPAGPVVIISEIVDGDLTGGLPKVLELTNVGGAAADLSAYQLAAFSNGASSPSSTTTLSGTLAPGESFVVSSESVTFTAVYGFGPDLQSGVANNNGDDTVALMDQAGNTLDIYGVPGVNGDNEPWDYTDSYAYRNPDVLAPNPTLDTSEWTFAGRSALDGTDAAAHAASTTPGCHTFTGHSCDP